MESQLENKRTRIRKPVRRAGAERHLLLGLLSFAASVSMTRLFLEMTGYPQIGGGELHIAHVLWGGLFLYIASLVPLLWANRWVYGTSAVLSGIGIGLFIDEVGKFITQTNDYFYPPAAPIIYALFLVTVLLYTRIRRPIEREVRSELYYVLDGLGEVLDHDFTDRERQDLIVRLESINQGTLHPDLKRLAQTLSDFIANEDLYLITHVPTRWDRFIANLQRWEDTWLNRSLFQAILAGAIIALGVWFLYTPSFVVFRLGNPEEVQRLIFAMIDDRLIRGAASLGWYEARLALQTAVGILLLIAAVFLISGKERRGISLAYLGLLLALTTVNLLIFYFDQFSSIITAVVQLVVLLGVLRYRSKYLQNA